MTAPAQAAPAARHVVQQTTNQNGFLTYARTREYPLTGSIPSGQAGGVPASNVAFTDLIPTVPAYARAVVLEITLPISLVVPANSSVKVSPYFPFSAMLMGLTLAGSPPWDVISLVPWFLDEVTSTRGFDQAMSGLVPGAESGQADKGPFTYSDGGFAPGATVTNATGSPVTTTGTVTFRTRVRLQRNPRLMFGCIPMGDPENRPKITMQLAALVGPSPEMNAFQDTASAGATATLSGAATVTAIFEGLSLDILPQGTPSIPEPVVGMGLAVNYATHTQQSAGQFIKMKHDAAMLYEKVFHLLVNAEIAQRADYFGNWLTGEQQSARWEFDATQGTFNQYYEVLIERYRRYLPSGLYVLDEVSGFDPDDPSRDLYEAQQTPDTGYAADFSIPATPAWTTALRVPAGTTMNNCYVALYEFGMVNVPY
jgi:hypothetical protein